MLPEDLGRQFFFQADEARNYVRPINLAFSAADVERSSLKQYYWLGNKAFVGLFDYSAQK